MLKAPAEIAVARTVLCNGTANHRKETEKIQDYNHKIVYRSQCGERIDKIMHAINSSANAL